jgi:hypothetical protein
MEDKANEVKEQKISYPMVPVYSYYFGMISLKPVISFSMKFKEIN